MVWSFGLLVFGLLVFWSFSLLVFWSFGLLVFWSFGLLVFWYFGLLVFWSFGILGGGDDLVVAGWASKNQVLVIFE